MTENFVLYALFGGYFGLMVVEQLRPGRRYATTLGTRVAGMAWFAVNFLVASAVPLYLDEPLSAWTLFDGQGLGTIGGGLAGTVVYQFVAYGWHRLLHETPLWRIHQTHHAIEAYDVSTAFVFHPVGMALWTAVSSVSLVLVLGVTGEAALFAALIGNSLALFQHSGIRTPQWLGYLVARPENHALHHASGVHRYNYADLSFVDMLFGTWKNPEGFPVRIGLGDGASARVPALLLGRDVEDSPPVTEAA